jgi:hypothetical protein
MDRINNILQFLSGQAPNVLPAATQFGGLGQGFGQLAAQQAGQAGQLGVQQGAVQAGLASSLGERFAGPLQQEANIGLLSDPRIQALLSGGLV